MSILVAHVIAVLIGALARLFRFRNKRGVDMDNNRKRVVAVIAVTVAVVAIAIFLNTAGPGLMQALIDMHSGG